VVLNGYLLLNLHIPGYVLWKRYRGEPPRPRYYLPFVLISIAWAVSIHTVTAFLYSGLGSRPFWNAAILAPRFLVSAFACGPALLIVIFQLINRLSTVHVRQLVLDYLRRIMSYTVMVNLFLLACEVFKEFYTGSLHVASAQYLFFGLEGHAVLRPYIWSAIGMEVATVAILLSFGVHKSWRLVTAGCVMTIVGIWIEKGMGLIIPGFVPDPLGEVVEYTPSMVETLVCLGIWAFGALVFTLMSKVVLGILSGTLHAPGVASRSSFAPSVSPPPPA
jgi:Ni/Fe-hydrogenase subunit HybB-like protein